MINYFKSHAQYWPLTVIWFCLYTAACFPVSESLRCNIAGTHLVVQSWIAVLRASILDKIKPISCSIWNRDISYETVVEVSFLWWHLQHTEISDPCEIIEYQPIINFQRTESPLCVLKMSLSLVIEPHPFETSPFLFLSLTQYYSAHLRLHHCLLRGVMGNAWVMKIPWVFPAWQGFLHHHRLMQDAFWLQQTEHYAHVQWSFSPMIPTHKNALECPFIYQSINWKIGII